MKMNTKILAVAIVAMFCITAFSVFGTEDSDAASKYNYHIYYELRGDTGSIDESGWYSDQTSTKDLATFVKVANAGAKDIVGVTKGFNEEGWSTYDGRGSTATFIVKDGAWTASAGTSDYETELIVAVIFGGYASDEIAAAEPSQWEPTGWGGDWNNIAVLDESVTGFLDGESMYHFYYEFRGETGAIEKKGWFGADADKYDIDAFAKYVNKGLEKVLDLDALFNKETSYFDYSGRGSVATFIVDGDSWVASAGSSDYESKNVFAIIVGGYASDEIAAAEPSQWESTGWGGDWNNIAVISESVLGFENGETTDSEDDDKDNTTMYIIIGVVAAIIVIAVLVLLMKKKKTSA